MKLASLFLFISVVVISSCSKIESSSQYLKEAPVKESLLSWLNSKADLNNIYIDSLRKSIIWKNFESLEMSDGREFCAITLDESFASSTLGRDKKLLVVTYQGRVNSVTIVQLSTADKIDRSATKELISSLANVPSKFTGNIVVHDVNKNFLGEQNYKIGKLISQKVVASKSKSAATNKMASCIDWYLVTIFYYVDGSTTRTEQYLFTSCGTSDCQTTKYFQGKNFKIVCGGSGGTQNEVSAWEQLCASTFRNFTALTSDRSSFALNIMALNFNNGYQVNPFNVWVNVQNYILNGAMNASQPAALPLFMPPGLEYKSPMEIIESVPTFRKLLTDGDIQYSYNSVSQEWGWSFNMHAYSIICATAADWAATNTYALTPSPATNPLAPSTFTAQYNGILSAIIPGSRVRAETNPNINSSFAVYSKTGCR